MAAIMTKSAGKVVECAARLMVMGQRDFPRLRYGAAADHARVGDRVVRTAEGPGAEERLSRRQPAAGGVDAGRLQALVRRQWRHDGRQPSGEHRLAAPRRTEHQDVVPTSRGHGECPLGKLLTLYVGKVDVVAVELPFHLVGGRRDGLEVGNSHDDAHGVRERANAINLDLANYCGLACVGHRNNEAGRAASARFHGHGERPGHRPDGTVERQFAHGGEAVEFVRSDLPGGDEHAEGDGQVKRAGVLAQIGGSEIDDCPAHVQPVAEVDQCALDTMDTLADSEFGQPDKHGLGHLRRRRVHLHVDRHRINADQGESAELG
jgi:hypothetical protein